MQPDEWGAANRTYPPSSGMPGPRDPRVTPYMIEFMRTVARGNIKLVVFACGAQMGKTEGLLDIIGERFDKRPAPVLYVGPSKDFNTDQFEPRLMGLLDEAPTLAAKVARGKRMKKTRKVIAGVPLRLAHAGSSTALKSDPAALALVDEYDEMLKNVKGQGDPLGLVRHRGDTYADFVTAVTSTPSKGASEIEKDEKSKLEFWKRMEPDDIQSGIWRLFQQGTMYHWAWPCPSCDGYFIPRFSCLRWDSREDELKTTPSEAKATAHLVCPHCGGVVDDSQKEAMNDKGVFVAPGQIVGANGVVKGSPRNDGGIASFWVSGLASPFVTFGERAEEYLTAVRMGDPDRIQSAVNAAFGELFSVSGTGDAPAWSEVHEKAIESDYSFGELPTGAIHLVLTADVQKNQIYYVIRAWGPRATSWLVARDVLHGETTEDPVWTDLADLLTSPHFGLPLRLAFIDSGFRPGKREELPVNKVYEFCRRFPRLVRPTKGASSAMRVPLILSKIEVTPKGKQAKYGLELVRLDTDHWKAWVHERIRWPADQPGAWHLPMDVGEDYCRQLISEARIRRPSGRHQWIQTSKANHYLDCEAMQAAAAYLLNVQRIPDNASRNPVTVQNGNATVTNPYTGQQRQARQVSRSSYMG